MTDLLLHYPSIETQVFSSWLSWQQSQKQLAGSWTWTRGWTKATSVYLGLKRPRQPNQLCFSCIIRSHNRGFDVCPERWTSTPSTLSRRKPLLTPLIPGQSRGFSWQFRVGWGIRQLVSINFSAAMGWMALTSVSIPSVIRFLYLSSPSIICVYTISKIYQRVARKKQTNMNQTSNPRSPLSNVLQLIQGNKWGKENDPRQMLVTSLPYYWKLLWFFPVKE